MLSFLIQIFKSTFWAKYRHFLGDNKRYAVTLNFDPVTLTFDLEQCRSQIVYQFAAELLRLQYLT